MGMKRNKYPHTRLYGRHYLVDVIEPTPEEEEQVKEFLTKIGYSYDHPLPIWKQFHYRHGLSFE